MLAVVVTFNPDIEALCNSLALLAEQGCRVLIVDNCSDNQTDLQLSLEAASADIQVLLNQVNSGLGAAHNQGLAYANEHGFSYVLVLDQDSQPLPEMVPQLLGAHQTLSQTHKVSAVGACYLNANNQSESFFVRFGVLKFQREYAKNNAIVEADFLISSGSLFSVDALNDIGGMDESLFIDHVDTEWFLRARHKGFKAFGVGAARMQHALGEATHTINMAGRQRNVPQHKPFRYYYIFRNSVALYKRSYTSWLWKWNDVQRLGMIFIMFGCLKAPRWQNMRMMLLGAWHGLIGKSGAMSFRHR